MSDKKAKKLACEACYCEWCVFSSNIFIYITTCTLCHKIMLSPSKLSGCMHFIGENKEKIKRSFTSLPPPPIIILHHHQHRHMHNSHSFFPSFIHIIALYFFYSLTKLHFIPLYMLVVIVYVVAHKINVCRSHASEKKRKNS